MSRSRWAVRRDQRFVLLDPEERPEGAEDQRRRAAFELGLSELTGLRCVVPRYVYQTPPFNGIVEHEFCPIFTATVDEDPVPDPRLGYFLDVIAARDTWMHRVDIAVATGRPSSVSATQPACRSSARPWLMSSRARVA